MKPEEPGHRDARRFLEECCRRCRCAYSSVHEIEMPVLAYRELAEFLDSIGAVRRMVQVSGIRRLAEEWVRRRGLSESRLEDTMHLVAARLLGCEYILAWDRFIWRNSKYFRLAYVNWETHGDYVSLLQKKPLTKWTSRDLRRWRKRISRLLVLVGKAGDTKEAW